MATELEGIKANIAEFCQKTESITVAETFDSAGNPCLEWRTSIILELFGADNQGSNEEQLSRQTVPVQFDVSFDTRASKILVFLQWGRIEPADWSRASAEIEAELQKESNVHIRYYGDRQVAELCLIYPFHEFDFAFVYEEAVSYFGIANGLLFKNAHGE